MTISVIIPCRNEVNAIEKCITSILGNCLADGYELKEIFVVDGMSDDGTIEIVNKICEANEKIRLINNPDKITPIAFNLGIKNSTGNFIQIIGSRQFVSKNYLQSCIDCFNIDPSIGCVGGLVNNVYANQESKIIALGMNSPFGVGGSNFRTKKESCFVDTVGTPMYKREIFDELGYFNESLVRNQDDEFNYRLTSAGYKVYFTNNASLEYVVRANLQGLSKQFYQYGYWKVYVNKLVGGITTTRQLFPAILVAGIVIGGILSVFSYYLQIAYLTGIAIYLSAALFFSFKSSSKANEIISVIFVFFILHFSYGTGYLRGLFDFLVLNKEPTGNSKTISR